MHILFLGNGFDLYHNLKTSYNEYLEIIKNIDAFESATKYYQKKPGSTRKHSYQEYFNGLSNMNFEQVYTMIDILKTNAWSRYYKECHAEIQGWIDFENEMSPVFGFFTNLFKIQLVRNDIDEYKDTNDGFIDYELQRDYIMATIWDDILGHNSLNDEFFINDDYFDSNYGLNKKQILMYLEDELNEFIMAFIIYLKQFIEPREIQEYKWIKDLEPEKIISFNYTQTEKKYFPDLGHDNISHIHGTATLGNIVLGNDLIDDKDIDFMHFSKKYQRMTKVEDFSFVDYLKDAKRAKGNVQLYAAADILSSNNARNHKSQVVAKKVANELHVSFIGCSLDKNDSIIFKEYIEEAKKVDIYCYGFEGFKDITTNLISIFGSETILEWKHSKKLTFLDIKDLDVEQIPEEIHPKVRYLAQQTAYLSKD